MHTHMHAHTHTHTHIIYMVVKIVLCLCRKQYIQDVINKYIIYLIYSIMYAIEMNSRIVRTITKSQMSQVF